MKPDLVKYEQNWINELNRGDVSPAEESFASNCIIHMAGAPEPNLSVTALEAPPTGKQVRFEGLIFDHVVGKKVVERWEQWDQMGIRKTCE